MFYNKKDVAKEKRVDSVMRKVDKEDEVILKLNLIKQNLS